jgi:hypothetical protein
VHTKGYPSRRTVKEQAKALVIVVLHRGVLKYWHYYPRIPIDCLK